MNADLVMVKGARTKVKLNKPIAVGFSILEISRFLLYRFYYDHLKATYGDRCSLLFTDTDNLCCEIQTDDLYADMGKSLDLYDTSNFTSDPSAIFCDKSSRSRQIQVRDGFVATDGIHRFEDEGVQSARPEEAFRDTPFHYSTIPPNDYYNWKRSVTSNLFRDRRCHLMNTTAISVCLHQFAALWVTLCYFSVVNLSLSTAAVR